MYRWVGVTEEAPFAGRDGAGALVFGGEMWLLGGWNPKDKVHFLRVCNSEVWSSRDGEDWTLRNPEAPWEGRHTAGYVVHEGRMWIVGGDCNQGHYQDDVWSSEDGVEWKLHTNSAPWTPRQYHGVAVYDGRMWIVGEYNPEIGNLNDVWYSEDGVRWSEVPGTPWSPRHATSVFVYGDALWVVAGSNLRPDVWKLVRE